MTAVEQLEKAGFSHILEAAQKENSPEAFKESLTVLLHLMDIRAPKGVFTPIRRTPGRRKEEHTLAIRADWEKRGGPPTTNTVCEDIAKAVFPDLINARKISKKLRDRVALVRSAIKRSKP
jgi:hypothetical protein